MSKPSRRQVLRNVGMTLFAAGSIEPADGLEIHKMAAERGEDNGGAYKPKLLNTHTNSQRSND